jgi:N-methylhydantoinase A
VQSRTDLTWTPSYTIDMRYFGQSFDLPVPLSAGEADALDLQLLIDRFDDVHEARYGHAVRDRSKEITGFRVSLRAAGASVDLPRIESASDSGGPSERDVYFKETGWATCPVYRRDLLEPGPSIEAPAVIEQMDTTTLVAPGFTAFVDEHTNILLRRKGA